MLRAENQSGLTGTPEWEPRARTGVYLGHSPAHAGNVASVLNLTTGNVSPQYHVVFDNEFTTVDYPESEEIPLLGKTLSKTHVKEQLMSSIIQHGHGTREMKRMTL